MNLFFKQILWCFVIGVYALTPTRWALALGAQQTGASPERVEKSVDQSAEQADVPEVNKSVDQATDVNRAVERSIDRLLDFCLVEREISSSNGNDRAKEMIVVFQTAYLLETMPDLFSDDARRKKVLLKADNQLAVDTWDKVSSLTSWVNGFATLYASEKMARGEKLQPVLGRLAESWVNRQNREGGWSHGGAGRLVDFYPSTVIGASNFALITLGSIKQFENSYQDSIDYEDVVDDALEMYTNAQSSTGGLPYGARSYQKGVQSARTATSLIGLAALGQSETDMFRKAARYSVNNVETVPFGHASPAMHIGCGSLAFAMLGSEYWSQYQNLHFPKILKAQRADGWFDDFSQDGSATELGSIEIETAYRTTLYAIGLTADKSEFIKKLRSQIDVAEVFSESDDLPSSSNDTAEGPKQRFHFELESGQELLGIETSTDGAYPLILDRRSNMICRVGNAAADAVTRFSIPGKLNPDNEIRIHQNRILVISAPEQKTSSGQIGGGPAEVQDESPKSEAHAGSRATCFDMDTGTTMWDRRLPFFREKQFREKSADLVATNGKWLRRIDLTNGKLSFETPTVGEVTTSPVFGFDSGPSYVGGIGRLVKHDHTGELQWTAKMRGKRGMIQPAALSIVSIGQKVFVSTASAEIFCFDSGDGSLNWKLDTQGTVKLVANEAGQLFAMGSDGVIQEVSLDVTKRRFVWSADIGGGREIRDGNESASDDLVGFTSPTKLVVHDRIQNEVTVLNSQSGKLEFQLNAKQVYLSGQNLVIGTGSQVQVYDLQ